ncbi:MAG: helix-turn-helix domain-containing protein [Cellulosilyticaceae bacterium]
MNVGKQIKGLRLQKNVKQEELAAYLQISYQAVSKWETGSSVPDISLLPKIATYFGVTIDELFQIPNEAQFERIENMYWNERRIKKETFEQVVHFLEEVIKEESGNVRAYENLAYLYNHRAHSDHELASEYAKKVLELQPDNKNGWVAYLEANGGLCGDEWYDNHFTVVQYFKEFLNKNPNNFRGLYAVVENLLADGRYDEALPYIQNLKQVKNNYQYYMYMGDVAYGKCELEEAKNFWNQAVDKYPKTWQAYCSRADRLKKIGMTAQALEDYEISFTIQEPPRISDGLYSLAQMHEWMGDYKSAIQDRKRIIQCLKEDFKITSGEGIDSQKREIERLRLLGRQ